MKKEYLEPTLKVKAIRPIMPLAASEGGVNPEGTPGTTPGGEPRARDSWDSEF